MSPGVLGQVVAAHEAAEAHGAGKPFLSCMGSTVARQLIRARESPLTALPLAFEGLFTCMRPHVGLEVGALEVGLAAVVMGTNMTAHTEHLWLQWGVSLFQQDSARRGGDGW